MLFRVFVVGAYFALTTLGLVGCTGSTDSTVHLSLPSIVTQPTSQTVTVGQTATFSVEATGAAPLSYQWQRNRTAISSATSSSYATAATTSSDDGAQFTVMVNNPAGSVTSNAGTLTVIAAVPTVSFSPTSLTFGNHAVGTSSSAQFVTFSNTGTGTLIFGADPTQGDFSLASQGTCSTSLAGGASCTLSIQFTPTTTGTRTGTLSVNDNASTTPEVVALTGLGRSKSAADYNPLWPCGHPGRREHQLQQCHQFFRAISGGLNGVQYGPATQYHANTHPSIGNYFVLTTGEILTNNDRQIPSSFPVSMDNMVRELMAARKTWKAYAKSLLSVGNLGGSTTSGGGQYYVRHVPVASLTDVQNSSAQQQNLVPFTQLAQDLLSGSLPDYSSSHPTAAMTLLIAPSASPTTGSKTTSTRGSMTPKRRAAHYCVR